ERAGHVLAGEQVGVVAARHLVRVPGPGRGRGLVRIPPDAAGEAQPVPGRVRGEQGAVTVHAQHAQRVIGGAAVAGGVQPGERAAGGAVAQLTGGGERDLGAGPGEVRGDRGAQGAAAEHHRGGGSGGVLERGGAGGESAAGHGVRSDLSLGEAGGGRGRGNGGQPR